MSRRDEKLLMRLLSGEASPAEERELGARLDQEPDLAAARDRLRATWDRLALPPAPPAPPGFAAGVRSRLGAGREGERPLAAPAPAWARIAAAAALVAGVALGAGLGALGPGPSAAATTATEAATLGSDLAGDSLADVYLEALTASNGAGDEEAR